MRRVQALVALLGIALPLTGCAKDNGFGSKAIDVTGKPAPEFQVAPVRPAPPAHQAAAAALGRILADYVDPIPPATLAAASLSGLVALDPALRVERTGNEVALFHGDKLLTRAPFAPGMEPTRVQDAFDQSLAEALTASPLVRNANAAVREKALIEPMIGALDGASRYVDAAGFRELQIGNRPAAVDKSKGFGVKWTFDGEAIVFREIDPGSFAAARPMKPGLRLLEIQGVPVTAIPPAARQKALDDIVDGPQVKVRFAPNFLLSPRGNATYFTFNAREQPELRLEDGLAVIHFPLTIRDNTGAAMKRVLNETFGGTPPSALILDLRDNSGGLLNQTVETIALFVDGGTAFTVTERAGPRLYKAELEAGRLEAVSPRPPAAAYQVPLIVVVNKETASGAEMIVSALAHRRRAVIVGTATTGTGLIQTIFPLPNGGAMWLTTGRVVSASGRPQHGQPIVPLFCTAREDRDVEAVIRAGLARPATQPLSAAECPGSPWQRDIDLMAAKRIAADPALFERALRAQQR